MGSDVFRYDDTNSPPISGATLVGALGEPPATPRARIEDVGGVLATRMPGLRRWQLTDRGEARVRAEAEGWLDTFIGGGKELAPRTWGRAS